MQAENEAAAGLPGKRGAGGDATSGGSAAKRRRGAGSSAGTQGAFHELVRVCVCDGGAGSMAADQHGPAACCLAADAPLAPAPPSPLAQLGAAGCEVASSRDGVEYAAEDPRRLR